MAVPVKMVMGALEAVARVATALKRPDLVVVAAAAVPETQGPVREV